MAEVCVLYGSQGGSFLYCGGSCGGTRKFFSDDENSTEVIISFKEKIEKKNLGY